MSKRVLVLMGGWSAEREVSLVSGAAVTGGLRAAGYDAATFDVTRDLAALFSALMPAPDAVFNALHGRYGEDGCVQGLLDILGIPYTHSGVLASALAMDKPTAKRLFAEAGVPVAEHVIADREAVVRGAVMAPPFVLKPFNEGSSVGVKIVRSTEELARWAQEPWPFGSRAMVERFIPGRELTVAVMGDRALAVTEITTERGFYDYDAKYAAGGSRHVVPAQLDPVVYAEAQRLAVLAHQTLGCRGVSRADFRFDGESLYALEVNTQPGMTPTSLVPEQAAACGMSFESLVAWMVEHAACD
ncbi:MAG: D-alanine--D-alanine ligase [Rhodospirillales bacterium]|jgi:D-alanine-D-alanine ligase|nr:D-alanine--D-alanine ligase [Rhodospirillales bacterium]